LVTELGGEAFHRARLVKCLLFLRVFTKGQNETLYIKPGSILLAACNKRRLTFSCEVRKRK
jgi:hypothetical protein